MRLPTDGFRISPGLPVPQRRRERFPSAVVQRGCPVVTGGERHADVPLARRAVEGSRRGDDAEAGAVSFRFRDGSQENGVPVADAIAKIREAIDTRAQV